MDINLYTRPGVDINLYTRPGVDINSDTQPGVDITSDRRPGVPSGLDINLNNNVLIKIYTLEGRDDLNINFWRIKCKDHSFWGQL